MIHRSVTSGFLTSVILAVTGCTFTSDGLELNAREQTDKTPVAFQWQSSDSVSGNITSLFAGRQFRGEYTQIANGKVLANLATVNGEVMHCRFELDNRASGVSGGGEGECELEGGNTIQARATLFDVRVAR